MFSKDFDIDEAYENIIKCSYFFFIENLNDEVKILNQKINLKLKPLHINKTSIDVKITEKDRLKLKSMLEKEYILFEKLIKYKKAIENA